MDLRTIQVDEKCRIYTCVPGGFVTTPLKNPRRVRLSRDPGAGKREGVVPQRWGPSYSFIRHGNRVLACGCFSIHLDGPQANEDSLDGPGSARPSDHESFG